MATATLERVYEDVQAIKQQLRKLTLLVEEDFELSESAKKELAAARKKPLSSYINHKSVLKEFSKG